jgi:hypothetical protein
VVSLDLTSGSTDCTQRGAGRDLTGKRRRIVSVAMAAFLSDEKAKRREP